MTFNNLLKYTELEMKKILLHIGTICDQNG